MLAIWFSVSCYVWNCFVQHNIKLNNMKNGRFSKTAGTETLTCCKLMTQIPGGLNLNSCLQEYPWMEGKVDSRYWPMPYAIPSVSIKEKGGIRVIGKARVSLYYVCLRWNFMTFIVFSSSLRMTAMAKIRFRGEYRACHVLLELSIHFHKMHCSNLLSMKQIETHNEPKLTLLTHASNPKYH